MTPTPIPAGDDPIARFRAALARAQETEPDVPNAAALATADARGRPSVRMVLVQAADERGFAFFTNYGSRKGRELGENPHAALCLHWKTLGEQVRVEGTVTRLSAEESDAYFAARPQESQLAAIASEQSRPLADRAELEQRFAELQARYGDSLPPRPSGWGGFRLYPSAIEFWYHRDHRLHHRELFERDGAGWRTTLLQP
jgi:pyridoxamine 5'-phosphate oxidase